MKNVVTSFVIATLVAIFAPHNFKELGAHLTRAGLLLVQMGLALDPPGYDAGWYDAGDKLPPREEA